MAGNVDVLSGFAQPSQHHNLRHGEKSHERNQAENHGQRETVEDVEGQNTDDGCYALAILHARYLTEVQQRAVVEQMPHGMDDDRREYGFGKMVEPARQEEQHKDDSRRGSDRRNLASWRRSLSLAAVPEVPPPTCMPRKIPDAMLAKPRARSS